MAKCAICSRPDAADIDAALVKDGPTATARAFGVAKTSLIRHRDTCAGEPAPTVAAPPAAPPDRAPTFSGRPGPGRPCETCKSPAREDIEARLIAGDPWLTVARSVPGAPSHDSIRNHATKCIPDLIRQAGAAKGRAEGQRLTDHVDRLVAEGMTLMSDARELVEAAKARGVGGAAACEECGSPPGDVGQIQAVKAAGEVIGRCAAALTLAGKFSGELDKARGDIRDARQWPVFLRTIGEAVADCDPCSQAVEAALEALGVDP